ncbi:2'-5' RNA ligase family protein [Aquipuribacter hungaricus]|uniref:2'-5' RNA ligase family protein n=1 Tax=Aquipuribacter hungaricus TaxID=545624 RepID=A0ABV7WI53_9MICO
MTTSWDRPSRGPAPAGQEGTVTLGVAVAVPEPFAGALRDGRASTGDPAAAAVPPHVTVVPPVQVAADEVDDVVAHVRRVAAGVEPFVVTLLGTGTFRPVSDVVFVQVVDGARACDALQEKVRTGPLERRLGFPYHPHVTVAHDVPAAALDAVQGQLADFRAAFDVAEVAVYRCGEDGVWRVLDRAPLGGAAADGAA